MWACVGGHTEVVTLLLSNGADVEMQKHDGKCAADIAAFKKYHKVIARRFLQVGFISF